MIQSRDGRIHVTYTYNVKEGKSIKHAVLDREWIAKGVLLDRGAQPHALDAVHLHQQDRLGGVAHGYPSSWVTRRMRGGDASNGPGRNDKVTVHRKPVGTLLRTQQ